MAPFRASLLSATAATSVATVTLTTQADARSRHAGSTAVFGGTLAAATLVSILGGGAHPADAAVIFSLTEAATNLSLSGTTITIGNSTGTIGSTLVGATATATMTMTNISGTGSISSTSSTSGAITPSVGSLASTIAKNSSDNFTLGIAAPSARGALTGTMTLQAWGQGGYTTSKRDTTAYTVNTTAVSAVASQTAATTVYALPGKTATQSFVIQNIGDGNAAGANSSSFKSNLWGTASATNSSSWSGSVAAFDTAATSLADNASSTSTFTYTGAATRTSSATSTITSSFTTGSTNNTGSSTVTVLTGVTVAPVASTTAAPTSFGTIRAGTTTTASLTVKNIGDGNKAGADNGTTLLTNLRGTSSTSGSSMISGGGTVNLTDSSSQNYTFTYAPTARGTQSASIITAFTNGSSDGKNASSSTTTTVSGTAVGPDYGADLDSKGSSIASGGNILFGDLASGVLKHNLLVSNISNDNASTALTNLTITAQIIGDAASEFSFSLSGFNSGNTGVYGSGPSTAVLRNVINGADLGQLAVQFVSKTGFSGSAQLRIQTDEESALGVMGSQVYVYNLIGTIPEPGTVMVLGTGLLGLAIARRRKRIAALTERTPDDAAVG